MAYLHIKFHMPSIGGSVVIAVRYDIKHRIVMDAVFYSTKIQSSESCYEI